MSTHWSEKLVAIGAPYDYVQWARTVKSEVDAWYQCQRGDWLLWQIGRLTCQPYDTAIENLRGLICRKLGLSPHHEINLARRKVLATACECAMLIREYMTDDEPIVQKIQRTINRIAPEDAWVTAKDARKAHTGFLMDVANGMAQCELEFNMKVNNYAFSHSIVDPEGYAQIADSMMLTTRMATLAKCADIVRRNFQAWPMLPDS